MQKSLFGWLLQNSKIRLLPAPDTAVSDGITHKGLFNVNPNGIEKALRKYHKVRESADR